MVYASPVATSAPLCNSVPVRTCNKVPVSSLIPPLLLELTPGLDPKLLLLPTEPLLLELLLLLLLLLPLLPDMLAPESDLLDMLDTNFSISSLFILSHYFISPTSLV